MQVGQDVLFDLDASIPPGTRKDDPEFIVLFEREAQRISESVDSGLYKYAQAELDRILASVGEIATDDEDADE